MEGQEWNEYMKVYMRDNYVHATVCLRKGRDDDIIDFLAGVESKSDYLRELIRSDIKKWQGRQQKGVNHDQQRRSIEGVNRIGK